MNPRGLRVLGVDFHVSKNSWKKKVMEVNGALGQYSKKTVCPDIGITEGLEFPI